MSVPQNLEQMKVAQGVKPGDFVLTVVAELCPWMKQQVNVFATIRYELEIKFKQAWTVLYFGEASGLTGKGFVSMPMSALKKYLAISNLHATWLHFDAFCRQRSALLWCVKVNLFFSRTKSMALLEIWEDPRFNSHTDYRVFFFSRD